MNIKDIFAKAENGTLTLEQFEQIANEGKAKFTDLSEGNYVSKSKYDDEIQAKATSIDELNKTIKQRDADLKSLNEQLANAGTDATKLADLQNNFTSLQKKYEDDIKTYQDKLAYQQYEFAVKDFANGKKFTSNAAKRDFTTSMLNAKLKYDANKQIIMGAEDFVKTYTMDNSDAFVTEKPTEPTPTEPKPKFAQSTTPTQTTPQENKNLFHFGFTPVRGDK